MEVSMQAPRSPSSLQVLEDATMNVEKRIEEFDSWYRNRKKPTPSTTPVKQVHFQRKGASEGGEEKEETGPSGEMARETRTPLQNKSNNWQPPSRTKEKYADNREEEASRLTRNVTVTSASNRSCEGDGLQSVHPKTRKSPTLIDLATPMQHQALARNQQTPAWAKEVSRDMAEQHLTQMPMSPATAKRSSLMNDVMLLLDEKTQECRKLYTLVKQLDAQTSPTTTTNGNNPHGTAHFSFNATPPPAVVNDWEDGGDKQAAQRHGLSASKSAGTQTSSTPKIPTSTSTSAAQEQKDLVCKLEKLLHEAKANSTPIQVEENHNQSQNVAGSSSLSDGIDALEESKVSANPLASLTSENTDLRHLNKQLQLKVSELEAENAKLKNDQLDCLEAVKKADELILKVLSQQQQQKA